MGLFGRSADLFSMPKFEYKHLSHHFKFTSQESKINVTPASVERVQKYVLNFEIYRFLKKNGQFTPSSPSFNYPGHRKYKCLNGRTSSVSYSDAGVGRGAVSLKKKVGDVHCSLAEKVPKSPKNGFFS